MKTAHFCPTGEKSQCGCVCGVDAFMLPKLNTCAEMVDKFELVRTISALVRLLALGGQLTAHVVDSAG